jgi:hypothetical protein
MLSLDTPTRFAIAAMVVCPSARTSRPAPRFESGAPMALAILGLLVVLLAGCGGAGSDPSAPVGRRLFGTLAGDPETGCVWIVPGDPGHTSAPVEIRLPSTVTVRFSPAVTVSAGGRTLRVGDAVTVEDLDPGEGRPGCPPPAQHTTIVAGTPQPWGGIVSLSTQPPAPESS